MVQTGVDTNDGGLWADSSLMARLSKCLDNCSVASTSDESSTYDLVQKLTDTLAQEYGESSSSSQSQYSRPYQDEKSYSSDSGERKFNRKLQKNKDNGNDDEKIIYEGGESEEHDRYDKGGRHKRPTSPIVQLPNRPTPYEVWVSKHHLTEEPQPRKIMTKQGLEQLINKLTSSAIEKNRIAQQKQHRDLANELRHLSFQPHLNRKSLELARNNKKLSERQDLLMKAKDEYLMRYREKQLQEEMMDCTFKPNLEGSLASAKALEKGGKSATRSTNDMYIFHRQKLIRLQQRQQLMQSLLARDLTFQPHLNQRSSELVDKMKAEGRISVDHVSKQTISKDKSLNLKLEEGGEGDDKEAVNDEIFTYQPKVNPRTAFYKRKDESVPIHTRLYHDAAKTFSRKQKAKIKMDQCIASFKDKDGIVPTTVVLQKFNSNKKKEKRPIQDDFVHEPTLNVVTYNHRYDDLITKIDPSFGRTIGA